MPDKKTIKIISPEIWRYDVWYANQLSRPFADILFWFLVEARDIVLVVVDPRADGKRDAGGRDVSFPRGSGVWIPVPIAMPLFGIFPGVTYCGMNIYPV